MEVIRRHRRDLRQLGKVRPVLVRAPLLDVANDAIDTLRIELALGWLHDVLLLVCRPKIRPGMA
jgi:hypothetical protein